MLIKTGRPVFLLMLIGFLLVGVSQAPHVASGLDIQPDQIEVPIFQPEPNDQNELAKPLIPSDVQYPFPLVTTPSQAIQDELNATDAFAINVWYGNTQSFGERGIPQPWVNILGNITLDPGQTMNQVSLSYMLNGGAPQDLSIGYNPLLRTRLYNTGDFNIELDAGQLLTASPNQVEITATDGNSTVKKTVTVDFTSGNVWPIPYEADWSTASSVLDLGQVVDGLWSIQDGELRNNVPGYDRLYAIGDLAWSAYEVTVPVTVSSLNTGEWGSPSNGAGIGLIAGWQGHYQLNDEQPREGWRRLQSLAWFKWNPNGSSGFELRGFGGRFLEQNNAQIELNQTYIFKLSVQPAKVEGMPATYRFKYWLEGQPEPATWLMRSEGIVGEPKSGSLLLVAHQLQASFGNVTVTPLPQGPFKLNVVAPNNGTLIVDPVKPGNLYEYGDKISIRAEGDSGYRLNNWAGDLSGNENPNVFDITQNLTVRANFVEAATDLTLTVNLAPGGDVNIVPEKPTYQYGELVTLVPVSDQGYLFDQWSGDHTGSDNPAQIVMNDSKVITASFVTANVNSPTSDDFNTCTLDSSLWQVVNPVGDGTAQVNGSQLLLTVPAGISHNIWLEGNRSLRVVQPTEDENFEMIAKFTSKVQKRYQMQGFLVEQDSKNFLRFEVHHDGSAVNLYAATFKQGIPEPVVTGKIVPDTPSYLRVTRSSDTWSFSYSFDGVAWFPAGSFEFPMTVNSSGVFAGNHTPSLGLAPEHVAVVDYFFNSQAPISPEDGNIVVSTQGQGQVQITPDKPTYTCGESITLTAVPTTGWSFAAWGGDISGTQSSKVITFQGRTEVSATFVEGSNGLGFKTYLPAILR